MRKVYPSSASWSKRAIKSQKEEAAEGNLNLFEKPAWAEGKISGSYEWDSTYSKYADPLKDGQVLKPFPILKVTGAVTDGVYRKRRWCFRSPSTPRHRKPPHRSSTAC